MKYFFLVFIFFVLCACQVQHQEKQDLEQSQQRALNETKEQIPHVKVSIPFAEFQARWNAISDEITFENQIPSLEIATDNGQVYGATSINSFTQLKVYNDNDQVEKIILSSTKNSNKENIFTMLSSWMQVILLTNPQLELKDIDQLFTELGIGPNADIDQLQTETFEVGEITYTVTVDDQYYTFTALMEG